MTCYFINQVYLSFLCYPNDFTLCAIPQIYHGCHPTKISWLLRHVVFLDIANKATLTEVGNPSV